MVYPDVATAFTPPQTSPATGCRGGGTGLYITFQTLLAMLLEWAVMGNEARAGRCFTIMEGGYLVSSSSPASAGGSPRKAPAAPRRASAPGPAPAQGAALVAQWESAGSVWPDLPWVANRRLPAGVATSPQANVFFLAPWPELFPVLLHATNAALRPVCLADDFPESPATQPFTSVMASRIVRSWDVDQVPAHQAEVLAGLARSPFTQPIPVVDDHNSTEQPPDFLGYDDLTPTTSGSLEVVSDGFWGTESGQWAVVTGEQDRVDRAPQTLPNNTYTPDTGEALQTPPTQRSSLIVAASIIALAIGVSLWTYLWWANVPTDVADPTPGNQATTIGKVFPDATPTPATTPQPSATVAPPTSATSSATTSRRSSPSRSARPTRSATSTRATSTPSTTRPVQGTPSSSLTSTVPLPHGDQPTRGTDDP